MRILRVVGSRLLPCGCFVGAYETYDGRTVEVVDQAGIACSVPSHVRGATLPPDPGRIPAHAVRPPTRAVPPQGDSAAPGADGSRGRSVS
jgi:hypothetical protein